MNKVIEVLIEALEIENREVYLTDNFKEYPEWDSLSRLSLIALMDEAFEIQIDDETFKKIDSVEKLITEVELRMAN
jgi:acyl carrier protein